MPFKNYVLIIYLQEQCEACGAITAEGDILTALLLDRKVDPSFFNKLHTQEPYYLKTGTKEIKLQSPSFSMVNFIQPHLASRLYISEKLNGSGASARFLPFFFPLSNTSLYRYQENTTSRKNITLFQSLIKSLMKTYYTQDLNKLKYQVYLNENAKQLVYNFEKDIKQNHLFYLPKEVHPALSKLHGHAVRLAWCIHVLYVQNDLPHNYPIQEAAMQDAISLCYVLLEHIKYAYNPAGLQAHDNAVKILENLKNINCSIDNEILHHGWIDSRTIQQRTHIKAKDVGNALSYLEKYNLVRIVDNGKAKNIVVVHPHFNKFKFD